jgi:hypothetical protein
VQLLQRRAAASSHTWYVEIQDPRGKQFSVVLRHGPSIKTRDRSSVLIATKIQPHRATTGRLNCLHVIRGAVLFTWSTHVYVHGFCGKVHLHGFVRSHPIKSASSMVKERFKTSNNIRVRIQDKTECEKTKEWSIKLPASMIFSDWR